MHYHVGLSIIVRTPRLRVASRPFPNGVTPVGVAWGLAPLIRVGGARGGGHRGPNRMQKGTTRRRVDRGRRVRRGKGALLLGLLRTK